MTNTYYYMDEDEVIHMTGIMTDDSRFLLYLHSAMTFIAEFTGINCIDLTTLDTVLENEGLKCVDAPTLPAEHETVYYASDMTVGMLKETLQNDGSVYVTVHNKKRTKSKTLSIALDFNSIELEYSRKNVVYHTRKVERTASGIVDVLQTVDTFIAEGKADGYTHCERKFIVL